MIQSATTPGSTDSYQASTLPQSLSLLLEGSTSLPSIPSLTRPKTPTRLRSPLSRRSSSCSVDSETPSVTSYLNGLPSIPLSPTMLSFANMSRGGKRRMSDTELSENPLKRCRRQEIITKSLERLHDISVVQDLFEDVFLPQVSSNLKSTKRQCAPTISAALESKEPAAQHFFREILDAHVNAFVKHDRVLHAETRSQLQKAEIIKLRSLQIWLPKFSHMMAELYKGTKKLSGRKLAVQAAEGAKIISEVIHVAVDSVMKSRVKVVCELVQNQAETVIHNLGSHALNNISNALQECAPKLDQDSFKETANHLQKLRDICDAELADGPHESYDKGDSAWQKYLSALDNASRRGGEPDLASLIRVPALQKAWQQLASLVTNDVNKTTRLYTWTAKEYSRLRRKYDSHLMKAVATSA